MLAAVSRLMNVLSIVLSARGQQDISDLLKTSSVLIREGDEGNDKLEKIAADIKQMVELGVNPSDAQIAAVREGRDALQADIDAVVIPDDGDDTDPVDPIDPVDPVNPLDPVDPPLFTQGDDENL